MDADPKAFASWLRQRATAAGFDPEERGKIAALAKAAGVDPAPVSRALSGLMIPKGPTQRAIAIALEIEPWEMYVRSGHVQADDVPGKPELPTQPTITDLRQVALTRGVPADRVDQAVVSAYAVLDSFRTDA